ncbi:HesA/MoeB/ThiF family protein [Candidatus Bathyarchaeota archaeon]|nr:HesA/MoeB/ThiF family protein [Candidatus Bathyarchaeota archaeon]MBS7613844.1 HesA/MoeB/ThiF family protein [Candidatus Bathyarchaeota archaeon]MBS7617096.1 HesA/MoeB/ThiF family protein [Candidatus Bathyarchaeota archaeon]
MSLSASELERYDRQIRIPGFGVEGQMKLKNSKVAVVGVGGLGCAVSIYLVAAGVGRVVLIDKEKFELNNLNRQVLGYQSDLGKLKVEAAKAKLKELNPEVEVEAVPVELSERNIDKVISNMDIVVDCLDNWETRLLINDYCVSKNIPLIHAAVSEFYGQITTVIPGRGPCLRCVFHKIPTIQTEVIPIIGAVPGVLASLEVVEAIKLLTGIGEPLVGRILFLDFRRMSFDIIQLSKREDCPTCDETTS